MSNHNDQRKLQNVNPQSPLTRCRSWREEEGGQVWTTAHWEKLEACYIKNDRDYTRAAEAFHLESEERWSLDLLTRKSRCLDTNAKMHGGLLPLERQRKRRIERSFRRLDDVPQHTPDLTPQGTPTRTRTYDADFLSGLSINSSPVNLAKRPRRSDSSILDSEIIGQCHSPYAPKGPDMHNELGQLGESTVLKGSAITKEVTTSKGSNTPKGSRTPVRTVYRGGSAMSIC